jgi:hypothetical protein
VTKDDVVCEIKVDATKAIECCDCHYAARGCDGAESVDYFEQHTLVPTGHHATLRALIVHAMLRSPTSVTLTSLSMKSK